MYVEFWFLDLFKKSSASDPFIHVFFFLCMSCSELAGELDEDTAQHHASLHPLHQTQPRVQAPHFQEGGGRT